jgi:hypothetical protein
MDRVWVLGACPNVPAGVVNNTTTTMTNQCFHLIIRTPGVRANLWVTVRWQAMCREKASNSSYRRAFGWALRAQLLASEHLSAGSRRWLIGDKIKIIDSLPVAI